MQASDLPVKFKNAFAYAASGSYIDTIPDTQAGLTPGKASVDIGFPPFNFEQIAAGGVPPWGADFNGLFNWVTKWLRWAAAGGFPVKYDAAFSSAVGGYPAGAVLISNPTGNGRFWISLVDNNTGNPDSDSTNWLAFPDLAVQLQRPNFANDTGVQNQIAVTLFPAPTSWAQIVGAPIRVGSVVASNAINNPTIKVNGLTPAVIVNPDGTPLALGQIPAGCTLDGIPLANGKFQLNTPAPPPPTVATSWPIPGFIMPWPNEVAPTGFLECNGSLLNIATYPNLWAVLSTRYGGDGVNTFRLPDYRGQFLRGWDHGRGLDPDRATRINSGGGFTGDHVGTTQSSVAGAINLTNQTVSLLNPHFCTGVNTGSGADYSRQFWIGSGFNNESPVFNPTIAAFSDFSQFDVITGIRGQMDIVGNSGSSETRPTNIYVMWVIKF